MIKSVILSIFIFLVFMSCTIMESNLDISDWTEKTHSSVVNPDYEVVFNQQTVKRLDIIINQSDWEDMILDMENNYGQFGSNSSMPLPGNPGQPGHPPPPDNRLGDENPIFVPCALFFEGREWYKVGIRYKGNSSLRLCWQQGNWKLPFKLDFDQYEDDYPELTDQRFYGFRQLSLSSNYNDLSLIREKVAPDIFRESGIRAPQTTFCSIFIDYGEGPIYFGLYTIVEVIDDTMLINQFGSKDGNCYKPEGRGATFGSNLFNESDFEKKTNEGIGDWEDIIELFDILHSRLRKINPQNWRNQLENVFNVDYFMKWLAINTVIQNWDTYGKMQHNYYLYNNPEDNTLTWIPWDNNEALNYYWGKYKFCLKSFFK